MSATSSQDVSEHLHALLLVSEMYPPAVGGSAVLFENIYSRLRDLDITVLADATKCRGSDTRRGHIRLHRTTINKSRRGIRRWVDLRQHASVGRTIRRLSGGKPTVVHCGRPMPEGGAALCSRMMLGPRFLCWSHGEDVSTALLSGEYRFVVKRVLRAAEAVICNSHHTAGVIRPLGIAGHRLHVVHPAVDPDRFGPNVDGSEIRRRFAPQGQLLLLSVGRFHRRKGQDLVIKTVAHMRNDPIQLHYVIVGDGDERERLHALAQNLGVSDRVSFVGEVEDVQLPSYYAACDVFVMPNRIDGADFEGFGIVYLEAAATGRPTIGGRSGGVPEAIAHDQTGFLVSGTDETELAHVIGQLANGPDLRRRMGRAGRKRVLEKFTWDRAAAMVRDIHEQISRGQA